MDNVRQREILIVDQRLGRTNLLACLQFFDSSVGCPHQWVSAGIIRRAVQNVRPSA